MTVLASFIGHGHSANPYNSQWERILAAVEDVSHVASGPSTAGPSHAGSHAVDPFDSQTSWSDVLRGHGWTGNRVPSDHHIYTEFDQDVNRLQSGHADPSTEPHPTLRNQAMPSRSTDPEIALDHGSFLAQVADRVYSSAGASRAQRAHAVISPPSQKLYRDPDRFAIFVSKLPDVKSQHGVWPMEIDGSRYLLHQIMPKNPTFKLVSDHTETHAKARAFLSVSKEVGPPHSGRFQFVGTVLAPYRQDFMSFRDQVLSTDAVRLSEVRALGPTTFEARLERHPALRSSSERQD